MRKTPVPDGAMMHRDRWIAYGVSARRLASDEFTPVFAGLHTPTRAPASFPVLCHGLQNVAVPGSVLSHTTAAVLLGLPLPPWVDQGVGLLRVGLDGRPVTGPVPSVRDIEAWAADPQRSLPRMHCRTPGSRSRPPSADVSVHRLAPAPTVTIGQLRVSHPLEAALELAVMLDDRDLIAVIDHLLGPGARKWRITQSTFVEFIGQSVGRSGLARLRRAVARSRPGVESPGESLTRTLLEDAGFPALVVNHPVLDPVTGQMRRIDLAYPEARLGIEFDGDHHRSDRAQWRADEGRRDNLAAAGWDLRRLTGADLREPAVFLERLATSCARRGLAVPPREKWVGAAGADLRWGPKMRRSARP